MKYPSLKSVNLIIVDGRGDGVDSATYLSGCLLALANRFDGHVLVLCSTEQQVAEVETLGEDLGFDFFFHGDQIANPEEFFEYCQSAKAIFRPGSNRIDSWEWKFLQTMNKRVIVPQSLARHLRMWPELIVLDDGDIDAMRIMKIILNGDGSR
jgi:hypothetical protein